MRVARLFLSVSIFLSVVQPIPPVNSRKTIIDTAFPILPASQPGPPAIVEERMILARVDEDRHVMTSERALGRNSKQGTDSRRSEITF